MIGFWYGSVLVHKGEMTAGKVITVFWSTLMAVQSFQGILPHILTLAKAQAAAIILKSVIETVNRRKRFDRTTGVLSPDFCDGDIEVRDVSVLWLKFSAPSHSLRSRSHSLRALIILC
jgi:ATP-binding cassette, subfamily B (MDR/TAP), member 1